MLSAPHVHIYHAKLWDTNYVARFYEICEKFLGRIYFLIFKMEAPTFFPEARTLIATMGDWYVGESFAYIIVWGSCSAHMLPKVVHDRLVIEEISFHIVWPKFPHNLGPLSIPTSTWATEISNHIISLKMGFASKR